MVDLASAVVLDNGAYTAKVGLATHDEPLVLLNCVMKARAERRRAFIGNQIDECRDMSGLFYQLCFQKGFLTNFDVQKTVWDHVFSAEGTGISLEDRAVLVTETQLNLPALESTMMEILFEEYRVAGVYKTTTAELAALNYATDSGESPLGLHCIVVDVGYSFTHVVPFVRGRLILTGVRRIEVGGKVLTNHLKEVISYRQLNMMDESYVVNQIKEDVGFVSQNFTEDMRAANSKRSGVVVEYVLPDFTTNRRGYVRTKESSAAHPNDDDQQTLWLGNERFTIPELLFNPQDVGINQMGIAPAIIDSLKQCPDTVHEYLLRNILIIGGSSLFPGFVPRLKSEIRALAPDEFEVSLIFPEDPISYGWYGGKELASSDRFDDILFSRNQYDEEGYSAGDDK